MLKYGGKQIFSHGSFPEVGEKQNAEKKKKKKVEENNGQLRFCPTPRMAHTNRLDKQCLSLSDRIVFKHCQPEEPIEMDEANKNNDDDNHDEAEEEEEADHHIVMTFKHGSGKLAKFKHLMGFCYDFLERRTIDSIV